MTSDANIEDLHVQTPGQSASDESVRTFSLSKDGRRTAVILLLGVASIWVFAIWSLVTILEEGISGVEWVSAFLMLGILVVAPMVAWTLLEEMNCRISISDNGLRYRTLGGVDLAYEWSDLIGFERTARQRGKVARFFLGKEEQPAHAEAEAKDETDDTDAADEPDTVLVQVRDGASPRISNPLVNFLHRQAHGSAVPIYGGLENRDELLGEIRARLH
jgi:hypothetical protein